MQIDVINVIYLIIRLSPLLVVSHFSLQSILNQDSKGVVYLIGLMGTMFVLYLVGKAIPQPNMKSSTEDLICQTMGIDSFNNLSLSQIVLGYTFGYLLFIILKFDETSYESTNISTLVLFPVLIITNFFWNWSTGCVAIVKLIISLVLGIALGIAWAATLKAADYKELAMFNGISNKTVCSKPTKQRFLCKKGKKI